jgi:dihydrofolate synthase / folylpolyglutamate synthase
LELAAYREALGWLYGLQVHGIKLGLENMRRLCGALQVDLASGSRRKFIHVAGTNGKGSVCAMLAALLCACGRRTGLYTSPHLVSFRERIRLGPNSIPQVHVTELLDEIRRHVANWEHAPTFFEVTTAMALAWFQRQRAEWVVLETGMGGRLDATNVVNPVVSVLTPIGMDHQQYLGNSLEAIAREKAGIMKPGVPIISAAQDPAVTAVFEERARELGSGVNFIRNPIAPSWTLSLAGSHQRMNAAVAFGAVVAAGLRPDPRVVAQAFSRVEWPGRFQRVQEERIVLDGAHNPHAAAQLVATWREVYGEAKAALVFGVLADKDVEGICAELAKVAAWVICVPIRNPRAMAPQDLAATIRRFTEVPVTAFDSLAAGLVQAQRHSERTLVAGSLFLVGETLTQLGSAVPDFEPSVQ